MKANPNPSYRRVVERQRMLDLEFPQMVRTVWYVDPDESVLKSCSLMVHLNRRFGLFSIPNVIRHEHVFNDSNMPIDGFSPEDNQFLTHGLTGMKPLEIV